MNRVVHFEIHAEDPERAAKFYSTVFGWDIKKWDSPVMEYWMVMTGAQDSVGADGKPWPGINGGLLRRKGPAPKGGEPVNAFVCTMDVEDIDATMAKAKSASGTIALDKAPIPGLGWLAYMKDTEGNIFGIMQSDPGAK